MNINNNHNNYQPHFSAGLTRNMETQISSCNPQKIESLLMQRNIKANFDNNKVVAWSVQQCISILDNLNDKFKLNLWLPREIYLEDFEKLNIKNSRNATGFCNFLRQKLYKGSDTLTDGLSIFFNKNIPWKYIDEISDHQYSQKDAPTDFFLDVIFHDFMHIIHEGNMLNKVGADKMMDFLIKASDTSNISKFQTKYMSELKKICNYATTNPVDAVACDLNKVISSNIDRNNLTIDTNPFINTPYEQIPLIKKMMPISSVKMSHNDQLFNIKRKIFNGELY